MKKAFVLLSTLSVVIVSAPLHKSSDGLTENEEFHRQHLIGLEIAIKSSSVSTRFTEVVAQFHSFVLMLRHSVVIHFYFAFVSNQVGPTIHQLGSRQGNYEIILKIGLDYTTNKLHSGFSWFDWSCFWTTRLQPWLEYSNRSWSAVISLVGLFDSVA